MGKREDEQTLPSRELDAQGANPSEGNCDYCCLSCRMVKKLVNFRCILVLVLLSVVIWLPFFQYGGQKDLDLNCEELLVGVILYSVHQHFMVEVISLQSFAGSDLTKVLFAVESDVTTQNLYIRLTNLKGSTVAPPTTVQSHVLLAVGVNPSNSRLKQLAQIITSSHSRNLGLNKTVFGRVKQVQLSSILQHSLGSGGSVSSPSPSLSPMSRSHHHKASLAPIISPSQPLENRKNHRLLHLNLPAPAPGKNLASTPPSCRLGYNNRYPRKCVECYHLTPSSSPSHAPHPPLLLPKQNDPRTPKKSSQVSGPSPLPNAAYAHGLPPSKNDTHARPPDAMPLVSPLSSPSSAVIFSFNTWALPLFILPHCIYSSRK